MSDLDIVKGNVDAFFLIVMGCIVFLMQCGFAFLEAGSVRYMLLLMEGLKLIFFVTLVRAKII